MKNKIKVITAFTSLLCLLLGFSLDLKAEKSKLKYRFPIRIITWRDMSLAFKGNRGVYQEEDANDSTTLVILGKKKGRSVNYNDKIKIREYGGSRYLIANKKGRVRWIEGDPLEYGEIIIKKHPKNSGEYVFYFPNNKKYLSAKRITKGFNTKGHTKDWEGFRIVLVSKESLSRKRAKKGKVSKKKPSLLETMFADITGIIAEDLGTPFVQKVEKETKALSEKVKSKVKEYLDNSDLSEDKKDKVTKTVEKEADDFEKDIDELLKDIKKKIEKKKLSFKELGKQADKIIKRIKRFYSNLNKKVRDELDKEQRAALRKILRTSVLRTIKKIKKDLLGIKDKKKEEPEENGEGEVVEVSEEEKDGIPEAPSVPGVDISKAPSADQLPPPPSTGIGDVPELPTELPPPPPEAQKIPEAPPVPGDIPPAPPVPGEVSEDSEISEGGEEEVKEKPPVQKRPLAFLGDIEKGKKLKPVGKRAEEEKKVGKIGLADTLASAMSKRRQALGEDENDESDDESGEKWGNEGGSS